MFSSLLSFYLCLFWSLLQHVTLPAWSLFFLCKPFVLLTPTPVLSASFQQPRQDHLSICAPWGSPCLHWYDSERWRKVGCRGRRKHHLWASPSASCERRTARRRWPSPSREITVRMNLCSWEGKSRATALLTVFLPASSLSSFSAIGLFWPLKQVRCGLPWISDLH